MDERQEQKFHQLTEAPVGALICHLAIPCIISMLVTAFYNMADTFFVGRLDTVSTAAVGLALPLMNIVQALGFFYGHGSGNYISGKLGEGDTRSAAVMADTAAVSIPIAVAVSKKLAEKERLSAEKGDQNGQIRTF